MLGGDLQLGWNHQVLGLRQLLLLYPAYCWGCDGRRVAVRFRGALRALLCVKYFTAAVPTVCVLAAAVCGLAAITAGVQSRCGPMCVGVSVWMRVVQSA